MSELKTIVLIDADNTNSLELAKMWAVLSKIGRIDVARAYGDWAASSLQLIRQQCVALGIDCIQQNVYVTGKNATDIAMAIDAVALCHAEPVGQVVLFSKDSDFTPLAHWLNGRSISVIGVGGRDSSWAFKRACTLFLDPDQPDVVGQSENKIRHLLSAAYVHLKQFYGKCERYPLSQVVQSIQEIEPDFSSIRYGAFSVREMLDKSECARAEDADGDVTVTFQFSGSGALSDTTEGKVQSGAFLKKMVREAKSLPFFAGMLPLSAAKSLKISRSTAEFAACYEMLQQQKAPPMVLHVPGHEPVLWLVPPSCAVRSTHIRGKELLLRAIQLQIAQQGQAVIFSVKRLRKLIGAIDPELTWSKYGVADLDGLIAAHPDLLCRFAPSVDYPADHVGVCGNQQTSLYDHLQSILSVLRSAQQREGSVGQWETAAEWDRRMRRLFPEFQAKNFAMVHLYSFWWVFKAQIDVQRSDGTGRPRQARFSGCVEAVQSQKRAV